MVVLTLLLGCGGNEVGPPGFSDGEMADRRSLLAACSKGGLSCGPQARACLEGAHGPRDFECVRATVGRDCETHPEHETCTLWGRALAEVGDMPEAGDAIMQRGCEQYGYGCDEWAWSLRTRNPGRALEVANAACARKEPNGCDIALVLRLSGDAPSQADVDSGIAGCDVEGKRAVCFALAELGLRVGDATHTESRLQACAYRRDGIPEIYEGCTLRGWTIWRRVGASPSRDEQGNIRHGLRLGCEAGDAEGCYGLYIASAHPEYGVSVPEQWGNAAFYLARACNLGMKEACGDPSKLPDPFLLKSGWDGGFRRGPE